MTNTKFITHLMEYSKSGAMMQLFILDALTKMSDKVSETPDEELIKAFGEDSFVSPMAWKRTAQELKNELEKRG